jgi:hypothetical protein
VQRCALARRATAAGGRRGVAEILLRHGDSVSFLAQHSYGPSRRLRHHRRQAFGEPVEEQEFRADARAMRETSAIDKRRSDVLSAATVVPVDVKRRQH